jgi:hypothetical protein
LKIDETPLALLIGTFAVIAVAGAGGCSSKSSSGGDPDAGAALLPPTTPSDGSSGGDPAPATPAPDAGVDGGNTGACLDDTGTALSCPADPLACAGACAKFGPAFKKRVGDAIWSCYVAADPTCPDPNANAAADTCFATALGKACADASASTFCDTFLASTCAGDVNAGKIDKAGCVKFATGLTQAGRDQLTSCGVSNGCNWCITADAVRWTWFN